MSVDPYKLVENGYSIFPVQVKNPGTDDKEVVFLVKSWSSDASNDPAQIDRWMTSEFGKNITDWAIPTGHRSGFIAVDIDSEEADAWWQAKWLPEGYEISTPRGGTHILYSLDGIDADVQTNKSKVYPGIDIRGEGGLIIAYADDFTPSDIPDMPDSVLEILPEKQVYSSEPIPENISVPTEVSPQEARVLKGLTDMLDALPRPWHRGAGYHDVQFRVACGLNRIANSPYYATNREQAHALFLKHAPLRDSADAEKRDRRWSDAAKITIGQYFEAPSDVPIRLDALEILDKFMNSATERLFWDSKNIGDVKHLIRELRHSGANEQEAYSISYDCAAMKNLRKKNPEHSSSTWGYVKSIYETPVEDDDSSVPTPPKTGKTVAKEGEWHLLTSDERALVRNYPNFIDRYILAAKTIFPEPNMPLHYVNAWIALSCSLGDRADIVLKKGRVPLSLWGLLLADTAAGKGDAKLFLISMIEACRRGGFGNVNAGGSASAEGLTDFIVERPGNPIFYNKDESGSLLHEMHKEGSISHKFMSLALDLYDGRANGNLRVSNAKDGPGDSVNTVFNMWLQTTWDNAMGALTAADVSTGFVGRFLVAVGDDAVITRDSLRPEFASEYQVDMGGVHPVVRSIGDGISAIVDVGRKLVLKAEDDVLDRYVDARESVQERFSTHPQFKELRGILLRVTENMLKAAGLLAVSEGRSRIEMPDLLLAMKSGQYWIRDAVRLVEAIGTSEYRRRVDDVIKFCSNSPKSRQQILKSSKFKNEDQRKVSEWLERAEAEGAIVKSQNGKYSSVEEH